MILVRNEDIEKIESVQRRFTKYIGGFKNLSYRERLLRLNAETLELRRLKSDLTLMYRTVYGLKLASLFARSDNITRGYCFKIQKQYSRVNCRAFSFAYRCIDAWNSLDNDVLCASSVQAFKRRLSLQNFTKFLYVL